MAQAGQPHSDGDDTFDTWLRKARTDAGWGKVAAAEAVAEVGVNERTYYRWEAGQVADPNPREVRKACERLGLDVREAAVALGLLTRDELELLPAPPPLPKTVRNILHLLRADQVPESAKRRLLQHIDGAVAFWMEQLGVKAMREPAARDRARGKQITGR